MSDRPGFAVRVVFREGDHAYWGWRETPRRARWMRGWYARFFQGYGIVSFTVVAISRVQFQNHKVLAMRRCDDPDCSWRQADLC
jgi:hypothetical protein